MHQVLERNWDVAYVNSNRAWHTDFECYKSGMSRGLKKTKQSLMKEFSKYIRKDDWGTKIMIRKQY